MYQLNGTTAEFVPILEPLQSLPPVEPVEHVFFFEFWRKTFDIKQLIKLGPTNELL